MGERGGMNLHAVAGNDALNRFDIMGLVTDQSLYFRACKRCICRSVDVTYEPGGSSLALGPYWEPLLFGISWYRNYGSAVHVHWNVDGSPSGCRYYQDEKGTTLTWKLTGTSAGPVSDGPSGTVVGVNDHVASQDYTDYMGKTFGSVLGMGDMPRGTYSMVVHWNVTFRCESDPDNGGGEVTRTDHADVQAKFSVPWW
jgi:hypothetical protein